MPFCTKCGAPVDDDAKFCISCGAPVEFVSPRKEADPVRPVSPRKETESRDISSSFFSTPDDDDLTGKSPEKKKKTVTSDSPWFTSADDLTPPEPDIPQFTPPEPDIPKFTPPVNDTPPVKVRPRFTPPVNDTPPASDIPKFTPPVNDTPPEPDIPRFIPPKRPYRDFSGPACHHHPNAPAVDRCARCGHYVCQDCAEAYTVISGEYKGQILCYDCCQTLVSENIQLLKKQRISIWVTFILTLVGMVIGLSMGSESGTGMMIFGMLWIGSFWTWIKNSISGWWHAPGGPTIAGFIGSCLGAGLVAPIITIRKIIQCIVYLWKTSNSIKDDSEALQQMRDYMEYTRVVSENAGVDIDTLMGEGSELYNNSYAQTLRSHGEEAADEMLRHCTTTIAENGEIIRSFAA